MSSKYVIRYRLLVLLFTFINLAVFALNSANIHFATILRERARSGYVDNSQVILDIIFAALQSDVLVASVVAAVPAALFSVFGLVLALQPRWLADNRGTIAIFIFLRPVVDLCFIVIGSYSADKSGVCRPPWQSLAVTIVSRTTTSFTSGLSHRPSMALHV